MRRIRLHNIVEYLMINDIYNSGLTTIKIPGFYSSPYPSQ